MKNRVVFIVLFLGMCCGLLHAQSKQGNIWYFGDYAGIDFNSGSPVVLNNGALATDEGCSSISDSLGNILFYTNGQTVWNRLDSVMKNGSGLKGSWTSTQSALIVPNPANLNQYYIFTVPEELHLEVGFKYSIVDMSLAGGYGKVINKNTPILSDTVCEKLTATLHANGHDIWVCIHEWNSDAFYAYLVTSSGINAPIISNVGSVYDTTYSEIGCMKFSPFGNRIASAFSVNRKLEIFDFDNSTGVISNPITFQGPPPLLPFYYGLPYGVEFSPSGSLLYFTLINYPYDYLYQFNMNAGSPIAILASATIVDSVDANLYDFYALQLAPDGKIYYALWGWGAGGDWIGVINNPESIGTSCNPSDSGVYLGGTPHYSRGGLPNFISNTFSSLSPPAINVSSSDTSFCEKQCINFTDLSTNNPTSWQWFFPGSDSLTSTLQNPTNICYNNYGSYDVTLIACNAAGCDTLHLTNFITCYQNPTDSIYQSNDTLFSLPAYAYQWYDVTNGIIAGAVNQYFIPQQAGSYYCVASDTIGCAGSSGTIVITGINQGAIGNWQLAIVPNPFSDNITIIIRNKTFKHVSFTIKNVLGQNVYSSICSPSGVRGSSATNSFQIDLSSLPKGIYLLDVMMDDEPIVTKIVKE